MTFVPKDAEQYLGPAFAHNAWLVSALIERGFTLPIIGFPSVDGMQPRFWIWRYFRNGRSFEYRTDYGRLVQSDLDSMIGRAEYEEQRAAGAA